jgi:hypothetical protein
MVEVTYKGLYSIVTVKTFPTMKDAVSWLHRTGIMGFNDKIAPPSVSIKVIEKE